MKNNDDEDEDLLSWLGLKNRINFSHNRFVGSFVGFFLSATFLILFPLAVIAAVAVLGSLLVSSSNATLGAGALITAMLGAPFLIWGTILKHQTVTFQKEGHMTDRINKAVEQLGVEKTVQRIGRSVTLASELTEGATLGQSTSFKNIIEWQGDDFEPEQGWKVKDEGEWKVFSESVPNIEVRVGALLSLERIAQDSIRHDRGRDHIRVMEILCAYIRKNSPIGNVVKTPSKDEFRNFFKNNSRSDHSFRSMYLKAQEYQTKKGEPHKNQEYISFIEVQNNTREDIQMAISVLGRRSKKQLNLERLLSNLRMNLSAVNFQGYDLQGLDFSNFNMNGSDFSFSKLGAANFSNSYLNSSIFRYTTMLETDFSYSNCSGSEFISCFASGVNFSGATLTDCFFMGGIYSNGDFMSESLAGTQMFEIILNNAHLSSNKNCNGLEIAFCSVTRAKICNISFKDGSSFYFKSSGLLETQGVALRDVMFSENTSVSMNFSKVFGDASVSLPSIIERPAHWPNWKLPDVGEHSYDNEYEKWRASPNYYLPPAEPQ